MNRYQAMTAQISIPAGQEERLKKSVLAAEPGKKQRVYHPKSLAKKMLLAALVAVGLTAGVGAAVAGVNWSWIFTEQFGRDAAATDTAAELFQEVGVTSVCDDVTLTVREAMGDNHTIYMILDYQLPDTVDRAELAERWREVEMASPTWWFMFVPTGSVTWEDIRGQDFFEAGKTVRRSAENPWAEGSASISRRGYDPESNILTWFLRVTMDPSVKLTDQPLTILADALVLGSTPLTDHPALVTFQPTNNAQTLGGVWEDPAAGVSIQVTLSPLALLIKVEGEADESFERNHKGFPLERKNYYEATTLVFRDGTEVSAVELSDGGSASGGGGVSPVVDISIPFEELLDITDVCAIRIGDLEIPVS